MNSTSCDCGCNGNCRRQVAYDESETNCINVENANGVQYLESPESPDHRSEFEATQSLSISLMRTFMYFWYWESSAMIW